MKYNINHGIQNNQLCLIWHGGEPLTAGIPMFHEILKLEDKIESESKAKFINVVQTNGTLINDEWANLFSKNKFTVGFSLDRPKFIEDIHRYNKNKESSFESTVRGIDIIKNHGIRVNVISVITNESAPFANEIYTFMRDAGVNTVDFIPSFCYKEDLTLLPEKYEQFMLSIIDLWELDGYTPLKIRFLNDIFKRIIYHGKGVKLRVGCELAGCCGQNFFAGIDGSIYPCECLTLVNEFYLGNIMDKTFDDFFYSNEYENLIMKYNGVNPECFDCGVVEYCRGGCLNRRLPDFNMNNGKDYYCDARKKIIEKINSIVQKQEKLPNVELQA
jgi:uncharacterized protein